MKPEIQTDVAIIGAGSAGLYAMREVRQAGRDIASRRFSATAPIAAPTYEALASAPGRLVDALAAEIAGALP